VWHLGVAVRHQGQRVLYCTAGAKISAIEPAPVGLTFKSTVLAPLITPCSVFSPPDLTIHHYYSTVLYAVIRRVRTCTWHSVFCCTVKLQKFSRYACLCGCIFFSTVYDCAGFPRRAELLGSQPLIVLLRNSRCARSYVDEDSSELPDISGRTSELVHQKTPRSANSCGNFSPVQLPSGLALRLRHRHWQVWVALVHCVLCSILPLVSLNITLIF
jgi:hypothetical protein